MSTKSVELCRGCTDDAYNNGLHGIRECWGLKSARVVARYKIGWWTEPRSADCFQKVKTYHCHREPGQYSFLEALPRFGV